jgi:LytTr DNA-binding domain
MRPISAKTELIAKLIIIPIAATIAGHVIFYHQFPWQLNYSFPWFYVLRVAIIMTVTWWINAKFYDRLDAILPFYRNPTQRILRQFTEGAIATLLVFTGLFSVITYFFADKSYFNLTAFTSGLVVCTILGTLLNAAFITAYLLQTIGFEKEKTSEITLQLNKNADIKNNLKIQKPATVLIESGNSKWQLIPHEMAYFYSSGGIVFLMKTDGQKLTTNYRSFSEIENRLDNTLFFQLNRQFIVQLNAIKSVEDDINRKLIIHLLPPFSKNQDLETVTVSRYRHAEFKKWFSMIKNRN